MKKEKQVKAYQRRTKSGKMVTVKAHTAKYDAAEAAKEAAKRKGAGDEFEARSMVKDALAKRSKDEAELIKEQLAKYGGEKGKELAKDEKKTPTKKPAPKKMRPSMDSGTTGAETKKFVAEGDKAKRKFDLFEKKSTNGYINKDHTISYKGNEGYKLYGDGSPKNPYKLEKATPAEIKMAKKSVRGEETFGTMLSKSYGNGSRVSPSKKQTTTSGVSSAEFKSWYHDPKSKEGKAAAKKLKEQVGAEKYKEMNKQANSGYSPRGHLSMFKKLGSVGGEIAPKKSSVVTSSNGTPTKALTTGAKRVTSKGEYTKGFTDFVTKHGYAINRYGVIKKGNEVQDRSVLDGFTKAYRSGSKVSFSKPKQTDVEKAYAQYHREQRGKGTPDYSSEDFMDFASTYKNKETTKSKPLSSKKVEVSRTAPTKKKDSSSGKPSVTQGAKPVPLYKEDSLTRSVKLPKGVTLKGGWMKVDNSGTKGVGHSSWSNKSDVYEAMLSDGKKVTLKRTYGPAGQDKVTFE